VLSYSVWPTLNDGVKFLIFLCSSLNNRSDFILFIVVLFFSKSRVQVPVAYSGVCLLRLKSI